MAARRMGETLAGKPAFEPAVDKEVPRHVQLAGMTLTFYAYFREAVTESRLEGDRVRHLRISYFLEDDTAVINEARVADSGIPQGIFLRRGKVPLGRTSHGVTALGKSQGMVSAGDRHLHWKDLRVGATLTILGRRMRVTSCDPATRDFYATTPGASPQPADESEPDDSFTTTRREVSARETGSAPGAWHGVRSSPILRYAEARLGNPSGKQIRAAPDTLGRFLTHGGTRLRFRGAVQDPRPFAPEHKVVLTVFPEDDTVSIVEVYGNNKGYDGTSAKLFKRGRLPRRFVVHDDRTRSIEDDNGDEDYFTTAEFRVGALINVMGRNVRITEADEATLKWLAEHGEEVAAAATTATSRAGVRLGGTGSSLRGGVAGGASGAGGLTATGRRVRFGATAGVDGMPNDDDEAEAADEAAERADAADKPVPPPEVQPSAYTGIGSEEDSLGSFFSLLPRYPRRDMSRSTKFEGMALKFKAKFAPPLASGAGAAPAAAAASSAAAADASDPTSGAISQEEAEARAVRGGISRIDATREFIVTWFMEDETITVYEPPQRNTGVIGGKFMSRRRLRNPATGDFFRDDDFVIGAELQLGGHRFHLYDAEGFTKRLLKGEAKVWGSSDVKFVLNNLRSKFADFSTTMRRAFRSMDKDFSGTITMDELETQLRKWGMRVTKQELVQIFNHYDRGDTGKWSFDDFCAAFTDPDFGDGAGGVMTSDADKASLLEDDELKQYEEHITSVRLNDVEQERLTRLLESFAAEFAARSGEERMAQEFRRVDLDKSNTVDRDEFRHALTVSFHLRDDDAALLERQFFPPGKEELDYEAFMKHLRGMIRRSTH